MENESAGLSQQSPLSSERNLPARVLRTLINSEKTTPLLTGTRGQPLLMCVTSMLAQEKYTLRGSTPLTKEAVPLAVGPMINNKLAGEGRRNLNVSNEAESFLNYAYFLGFTEPYLNGWVMDPTRAIEGILITRAYRRDANSGVPQPTGGVSANAGWGSLPSAGRTDDLC